MRRLGIVLALAVAMAALASSGCGDDGPSKGSGGAGGTGGQGGSGGEGGDEPITGLGIPGLSAPVEASIDDAGILHLSCETDDDCVAALGYFHADNRFFQMDLQRRYGRGQLAAMVPMMLSQDTAMRPFMSTRDGEPLEDVIWEMLDDELKGMLEAYSAGVNAWLDDARAGRNGAKLTEEYLLPLVNISPAAIRDWEPKDSVAIARLMTLLLSDTRSVEMMLGEAFPTLPTELAADFFTVRPGAKSYTVPAGGAGLAGARAAAAGVDLEGIEALQARLAPVAALMAQARSELPDLSIFADPQEAAGSNNWVVAPERTTAGKALLANDPHLSLSNPSIWYLAEMDSKTRGSGTLHVAGGTFPGIPSMPIGRNENLAWGATVAYYDAMDIYVETLNEAGDAVIFNGEEVKLLVRELEFEMAGSAPVTRTVEWVPHHGPVVAKDVANRTAITVKWTGHEATNELKAFVDLTRASTVEEGKEALETFKVGAQNFVLADTKGSIGWYPHANIPTRPWASFNQADPAAGDSLPPWMPLPGDGSAEWGPYIPAEELPQLFDPADGFIATANQDMNGSTEDGDPTNDDHPMLQSFAAPGFRQARILEWIGDRTDLTPEAMIELQGDTFSTLGAMIVPHLLEAAAGGPSEPSEAFDELVDALANWDFFCPTGLDGHDTKSPYVADEAVAASSIGCTAFHFTLARVLDEAYGDKLALIWPGKKENERMTGANLNWLIRPLVIALERPEDRISGDALWNRLDESGEVAEVREPAAVLLAGLERAATSSASLLGADPNDWRWGRFHTVTFRTELSALVPTLDLGPFPTHGGLFTVNVANPQLSISGRPNYSHSNGASLRIVSELSEESGVVTWIQLPGGQDLHRDGAHYGDLVPGWLDNEPVRFLFEREEVDDLAVSKVTVEPR